MISFIHTSIRTLATTALVITGALTQAETTLNPSFNYLHNGQLVSPWTAAVGNKSNWHTPVTMPAGATEDGDFNIEQKTGDNERNYLQLNWSGKKDEAYLTLSGPEMNLAPIEDQVALVFDYYLESKIKRDTAFAVKMSCGEDCKGGVELSGPLRKQATKQWGSLPIPLNCFSKNGADLSKINTPFMIQVSGKVSMRIANIQLLRMAEGDKGCKEEE